MSAPGAFHAGPESLVEAELHANLLEIGDSWNADAIAYVGPLVAGVDDVFRDHLEEIKAKKSKLVVLIETAGGYIEVTQRIAETFRHHYSSVEFVVPNSCMSAGTVLVMSGDAIHMDYYSVLGPIDPQVPDISGRLIPASGYLRKFEELITKSAKPPGLSDAEIAYLVQKFDPAALYDYEHACELSVSLLKEWLVKYKFRDWKQTATRKKTVTAGMKQARAEAIAKALQDVDRWHSHGRGISMSVLSRDLNLVIEDLEKSQIYGKLRAYYKPLKGYLARRNFGLALHGDSKLFGMGLSQ